MGPHLRHGAGRTDPHPRVVLFLPLSRSPGEWVVPQAGLESGAEPARAPRFAATEAFTPSGSLRLNRAVREAKPTVASHPVWNRS
jgi:hypothetical protein